VLAVDDAPGAPPAEDDAEDDDRSQDQLSVDTHSTNNITGYRKVGSIRCPKMSHIFAEAT
jgi:hypothetical protein